MTWKLWVGLSVAVTTSVAAQIPTVPETAARSAEPVVKSRRLRDIISIDLADLLARTDLVVRGRIAPLRSYLSEDQRTIYTDYVVSPAHVIGMRPVQAAKPTMGVNEITFTHYGGAMTFGSVTVDMRDDNLPPFEKNPDVILLLRRAAGAKTPFVIVDAVAAFEVVNGRVRPMVDPPLQLKEFRGMRDSEFVSRIHSMYKH